MAVFARSSINTASSFEHLQMWPFEVLHLVSMYVLLQRLDNLGLIPILVATKGEIFTGTASSDIFMLGVGFVIIIRRDEQNITSNLLSDIKEDLQVTVA